MMRLLQGDVGSGKTAVAMLALLAAAGSGWQGALMAPTEVWLSMVQLGWCWGSGGAGGEGVRLMAPSEVWLSMICLERFLHNTRKSLPFEWRGWIGYMVAWCLYG